VAGTVGVLVDAVVVSAAAGAIGLAIALVVTDRASLSGHARHLALSFALLLGPACLAGLAIARPGPIGCLVADCGGGLGPAAAGALGQRYAFEAAGKFPGGRAAPAALDQPRSGTPAALLGAWSFGVVLLGVRMLRRRHRLLILRREAAPIVDPGVASLAADAARRGSSRAAPWRAAATPPCRNEPSSSGCFHRTSASIVAWNLLPERR